MMAILLTYADQFLRICIYLVRESLSLLVSIIFTKLFCANYREPCKETGDREGIDCLQSFTDTEKYNSLDNNNKDDNSVQEKISSTSTAENILVETSHTVDDLNVRLECIRNEKLLVQNKIANITQKLSEIDDNLANDESEENHQDSNETDDLTEMLIELDSEIAIMNELEKREEELLTEQLDFIPPPEIMEMGQKLNCSTDECDGNNDSHNNIISNNTTNHNDLNKYDYNDNYANSYDIGLKATSNCNNNNNNQNISTDHNTNKYDYNDNYGNSYDINYNCVKEIQNGNTVSNNNANKGDVDELEQVVKDSSNDHHSNKYNESKIIDRYTDKNIDNDDDNSCDNHNRSCNDYKDYDNNTNDCNTDNDNDNNDNNSSSDKRLANEYNLNDVDDAKIIISSGDDSCDINDNNNNDNDNDYNTNNNGNDNNDDNNDGDNDDNNNYNTDSNGDDNNDDNHDSDDYDNNNYNDNVYTGDNDGNDGSSNSRLFDECYERKRTEDTKTHAIDYQEQLRILRDLCTSTQEMLISTQSDLRKSEEFRKDENLANEIVVRASDLKYKILRQKYENLKKQGNFRPHSRNSINSLHSSFDIDDDAYLRLHRGGGKSYSPYTIHEKNMDISPDNSRRSSSSSNPLTTPENLQVFIPVDSSSPSNYPTHTPPQNPRSRQLEILIDHYIDMDIEQSNNDNDMSKNPSTIADTLDNNGDDEEIHIDSKGTYTDNKDIDYKEVYIDNYIDDSNKNIDNSQSPSSIACILKTPNHSKNYGNENVFVDNNDNNNNNNNSNDNNDETSDTPNTTQELSISNTNNSSFHRHSVSSPPLYPLTVPTHTPPVRTSPSVLKSPSVRTSTLPYSPTMTHTIQKETHTNNKSNMKSTPHNITTFPISYTNKHPYPIPKTPVTPLDLGAIITSTSSGIRNNQKNVRRKNASAEKPNNKRWSI